jgi:uncharacterized protein YkwD
MHAAGSALSRHGHLAPAGERASRTLGRRRVVVGLAAVAALLAARPAASAPALDHDALAIAALECINAFRVSHDRKPLVLSARLQAAAQAHADDLAAHDIVSHTSSDGTDAIARIRRFYPYDTWVGENVAAGYASPDGVVAGWQDSPAHRAGLLLPEFHAVGVGVAANEQSRYRWFWVCDLGGEVDEAS